MDFWGDRRGQPVQIGFILLFGILVLAFASYQGYVVPSQNANIEVNHFQTVEGQFAEFDTNVVNTVGNDVERSSSFALGVQYPSRLIALNPPPVSGRLETTEPRRVSVVNDSGADVTASICGSSDATSRSLVYTPQYNEYREARSTTYENTLVTRSFGGTDIHGDQRLVRTVDDGDDRIDLLLLNRSVDVAQEGTYSLKLEGTHRYSKTVENPEVTISTQFSSTAWEDDILGDMDDVNASDVGTDRVSLAFDGGKYEVSCAVVGLGGEPAFEPPPSDDDDSSTFDTRWTAVEVGGDNRDLGDQPINVRPGDTVEMTMKVEGRESGHRIDEPLVGYAFSYDVDNDGAYDFGRSPEEIDGGEDTISYTVPGSNQAANGDTFEAYVTAGDDSDGVTFEVLQIGAGLRDESASDIVNSDQTFSFTIDELAMDVGETVSIDLSDVDQGGNDLRYVDASLNLVQDDLGSLTEVSNGNEITSIEFQAGQDVSTETTIEIEVTGIGNSQRNVGETYSVTFERSDGSETVDDDFLVVS